MTLNSARSNKLPHEIKLVGPITLYFAFCFTVLMLLKRLVLAQYQIGFRGFSVALVGALVAAKVLAVLENVPLWGRGSNASRGLRRDCAHAALHPRRVHRHAAAKGL